jgi:galactose-1-phosphate uridylyltransferase
MELFFEELLEGRYLGPGGREEPYRVLRRIDPVTGFSVRITGDRPLEQVPGDEVLPDLSERVERTRGCPFCDGNVESQTPACLGRLLGAGGCSAGVRFQRGASTLFPNIAPYGRHSAVCLFSGEHHIPLGEFPHARFLDALDNCLDYAQAVLRLDPTSTCQVVSQNILPASGGALLHPHLQVNLDHEPMNYHRLLLQRVSQSGPDGGLLAELARAEERGPRFLWRCGDWVFFAAFAPLAAWEVHAVHLGCRRFADLDSSGRSDFVAGLLRVHRYWHGQGRNAANMGLFGTSDGRHHLFARLMVRATWRPWYRSDRSAYEVAMLEHGTDMLPEALAERMRT